MMSLCPGNTVALSIHLIMMMQLFQYHYGQQPKPAIELIQHLSKENFKISSKASTKPTQAPKGRKSTGIELNKDDLLNKTGKHGFKEALKMITNLHQATHLELANLDAKAAIIKKERLNVNAYPHAVDRRSVSTICSEAMGHVNCPNTDECIGDSWVCDGENDCRDGWDEMNCMEHECSSKRYVKCDKGVCVDRDAKCNGTQECPDGRDEKNCVTKSVDTNTGVSLVSYWGCIMGISVVLVHV